MGKKKKHSGHIGLIINFSIIPIRINSEAPATKEGGRVISLFINSFL